MIILYVLLPILLSPLIWLGLSRYFAWKDRSVINRRRKVIEYKLSEIDGYR